MYVSTCAIVFMKVNMYEHRAVYLDTYLLGPYFMITLRVLLLLLQDNRWIVGSPRVPDTSRVPFYFGEILSWNVPERAEQSSNKGGLSVNPYFLGFYGNTTRRNV